MNIAIEQIQHGNEQAFKSLFDEYYQGLCVFASAYLKDDDLSADVVQEAFVKFWNRRRDFDHIVKIKSFLYTIVSVRKWCWRMFPCLKTAVFFMTN